jgi:hypothetical protein
MHDCLRPRLGGPERLDVAQKVAAEGRGRGKWGWNERTRWYQVRIEVGV